VDAVKGAPPGSLWGGLAKALDASRSREGCSGHRHFQSLQLVENDESIKDYKTENEFLTHILHNTGFQKVRHTCLIAGLVFKKEQKPSRHAIAVLRDNVGKCHMFDPNIGVFEFKDVLNLYLAMTSLVQWYAADRDWGSFQGGFFRRFEGPSTIPEGGGAELKKAPPPVVTSTNAPAESKAAEAKQTPMPQPSGANTNRRPRVQSRQCQGFPRT
jgi:hypothetical protein